jgi:hypothetical protein
MLTVPASEPLRATVRIWITEAAARVLKTERENKGRELWERDGIVALVVFYI